MPEGKREAAWRGALKLAGDTRPAFESPQVSGMIQMAVGEQNRLDGLRPQSQLLQFPPEEQHFPEQPRINHYAVRPLHEQETASHNAPDGIQAGRNVFHVKLLTEIAVRLELIKMIPTAMESMFAPANVWSY